MHLQKDHKQDPGTEVYSDGEEEPISGIRKRCSKQVVLQYRSGVREPHNIHTCNWISNTFGSASIAVLYRGCFKETSLPLYVPPKTSAKLPWANIAVSEAMMRSMGMSIESGIILVRHPSSRNKGGRRVSRLSKEMSGISVSQ